MMGPLKERANRLSKETKENIGVLIEEYRKKSQEIFPEKITKVFNRFLILIEQGKFESQSFKSIVSIFGITPEEAKKEPERLIYLFFLLLLYPLQSREIKNIDIFNKVIKNIRPSDLQKIREIWLKHPEGIKISFKEEPQEHKKETILIPHEKRYYFWLLRRFENWKKIASEIKTGPKPEIANDIVEKRKEDENLARKNYLIKLDTNLYFLLGKEGYLQFLEYFKVKSYRELLYKLNENFPPMNPNCRVVVIIPSRLEGKNIENVLKGYLKQVDDKNYPLDKSLFEIIILVNRQESEKDDESERIIKEFQQKHPKMNIRMAKIVFPDEAEFANVGMSRKIISDLALLRSQHLSKPLYFITEDADTISVDSKLVFKTIKRFDQNYSLDALKGIELRDPQVLKEMPVLFFKLYLSSIIPLILQRGRKQLSDPNDFTNENIFRWSRLLTGGWATAFTAEALMNIGGYLPIKMSEDMAIGELISLLRGEEIESKWGKIIGPNNNTVSTFPVRSIGSIRRFLAEFIGEIQIAYSSAFGSIEEVQALRNLNIEEILRIFKERKLHEINEETKPLIENELNYHRNFLIDILGEKNGNAMFKRLMILFLGFSDNDFEIKDGRVFIKNIEKLRSIFEKYKSKAEKLIQTIKTKL